ncbi:hypothetical protein MLD38_003466 [Melastoma candidum]|uniref:Uncharacterized protein n=1 Tax=Melastoma candidum TaxID=119954 RepID=A0ACB9S261_9MYRT|nr:hypothetical protein MLD38_003466 [Melastoma candidum]
MGKQLLVRNVWAHNIAMEFEVISYVLSRYKFVSMDTEFPGVLFPPSNPKALSPSDKYAFLKRNVDSLKIIQLGLTLSDSDGNLPDLRTNYCYIWQFNFRDFDPDLDAHNPDSISLLREHGIKFDSNRIRGIDSAVFASHMFSSGLLCDSSVVWVTFQGGYDFGYLMKIITRKCLPASLDEFLEAICFLFGDSVYDVKHMTRFCVGLQGGLERVAKALEVDREVGDCHQAGSDSLLTWRAFKKLCDSCLPEEEMAVFADIVHGLVVV